MMMMAMMMVKIVMMNESVRTSDCNSSRSESGRSFF